MTRICYVSAPDIMLPPQPLVCYGQVQKVKKTCGKTLMIHLQRPNVVCGDGTIESFLDDPTKSRTQHKMIIWCSMVLDDAL